MRYARILFFIVLLLCGLETVRLWFLAPETMATHFNVAGNPDRFVPKLIFFAYQAQTVLVVVGLGVVMQLVPLIVPARWVHMPNRDHWYAPERREATVLRLSSFAAAIFTLILVVIQGGFELAVSANLHQPIHFAAEVMVPLIIGFIILSLAMVGWLVRGFGVGR